MTPPIRFLSPLETARRLGVSVKALRVYEDKGLVEPVRTQAGWRAYGPEQMARLHQILALKRLGLPLKRIADLLSDLLETLDAVLQVQEEALKRQKAEAERGLRLLAATRRRLAKGETLSMDDLSQLTRGTTMTENRLDPQEWKRVMEPLKQKYFTPEEQARMTEHSKSQGEAGQAAWDQLIGEAKTLRADGADPSSAEAMDLTVRWMGQARGALGGDPAIGFKLSQMWKEAFRDDTFRERSPVSPELMAYVGQAISAAYAARLMAFP